MTLIELLLATTVLSMIAVAIGTLAVTVRTSSQYSQSQGTATQHARVALQRMERAMLAAHTSPEFPGFTVFGQTVQSWHFPDTLVVWRPTGVAADPDGLPRFDELIVFCPDPAEPNVLLEITLPADGRTVPALGQTQQWADALAAIKKSSSAERTRLTDRIRVASVDTAAADSTQRRAAVRFELMVRPSIQQWEDFRNGVIGWDDLPWVQGIYGSGSGLRQSWCRVELQLVPHTESTNAQADTAIPFFGSVALYQQLAR